MSTIRRIVAAAAVAATASLLLAGTALAAPSHNRPSRRTDSSLSHLRCAAPGHPSITVVLVHGAWAQPSSWNGEVARLHKDGCSVHAIGYPVQDLTTDSEAVADYVNTIPGPVLLVGHSYGGAIISNVGDEAHNVVGLVYVDAYEPAVGEAPKQLNGASSVLDTLPMSTLYTMFPYPGAPAGASDTILTEPVFVKDFASDLPANQARQLYDQQTPASTQAFATPAQYAAWQRLPSWAFISTGDKVITPQEEEFMAHRAHSHITVFPGGSHLTLVSHPAAVTATIGKALQALVEAQ